MNDASTATSSISQGRCPSEKHKTTTQDTQDLLSTSGSVVRKFIYAAVEEMALLLVWTVPMCLICVDLLDQMLPTEADLSTGGKTPPWVKDFPILLWSPMKVKVP